MSGTGKQGESAAQGLVFPCDYPIKAMGLASAGMQNVLTEIAVGVLGERHIGKSRQRSSSGGRFVSVTLRVTVNSRQQLEKIYRALKDHDDVLVTL